MDQQNTQVSYAKHSVAPFYIGAAAASFSSDGKIIATAVGEEVVVMDRTTGDVILRVEGDSSEVTAVQLTADGGYVAVAGQSQQVRVVKVPGSAGVGKDSAAGARAGKTSADARVIRLSAACYITAADSTSSLLAFGLADGSVIVWDVERGVVTHRLHGHGATVCGLSFHGEHGGSAWWLASGDIRGAVRVWDLVARRPVLTEDEHTAAARGLGFNRAGTRFVSAGRDGLALVYETTHWHEVAAVPVEMAVEAAGFVSYNGECLFTAGEGCVLRLWDLRERKLVASTHAPLKTTEELLMTQALVPETGTKDNAIIAVLSDQTIEDISLDAQADQIPVVRRMAGNHGVIADMRYAAGGIVALATNSPALRLVRWPAAPYDYQLREGHTDLLNALDASADGQWLATASKDTTARIWHYENDTFVCRAVLRGHSASVTAVALARGPGAPAFVVTASDDQTIKRWDIAQVVKSADTDSADSILNISSAVFTRHAHDKSIHALDLSPDNTLLVTASHDKTLKIWDASSGETVAVLRGHRRAVYDARFSEYGDVLASCSSDGTVRVWSLEDFTCTHTYQALGAGGASSAGGAGALQRVRFIHHAHGIVCTGSDGLIRFWDIGGEPALTLDNHDNRVWALCVKDDGAQMISADADGFITVWDDDTAQCRERAAATKRQAVEQDQKLQNLERDGHWAEAFQLAVDLDRPMTIYRVLSRCIATGPDEGCALHSEEVEAALKQLPDEKILRLFVVARDWNANRRLFEVAQRFIRAALARIGAERLAQIPGLVSILNGIIPYSARHYARYDDLVEQSYALDYVAAKMGE